MDARDLDRGLNQAFGFVVWMFGQLFQALAWAWAQTPAGWEWWWRALLLAGIVLIGPRLAVVLVRRLWRLSWGMPKIFGRARFASVFELWRAGLLRPGGRFLGQLWGRDIALHGEGHCLTVAAQGSGKTTGLIIPTLITYDAGSVVVTDPKGAITAQTRRLRASRGRVVVLNPWRDELMGDPAFALDLGDEGFNPLQLVGFDRAGRSAAAMLAGLLLPDMPGEESYWRTEARDLLEWAMLYQAAKLPPDKRTLPALQALLYDPAELTAIMERLVKDKHPASADAPLRGAAAKFYGLVAMQAGPQFAGAQGTAATALKIYSEGSALGEHVSRKGGFMLSDLKGETPLTLYLICPPNHLVSDDRKWLNLVLALITQEIGKPGAARETVLLMDEFPALGYLPNLLPALEQFREAGLRAHLIAQNPGQIIQTYGQDGLRRLWGAAEYKQFFRITDPDQARQLSEWLGNVTVRTENISARGDTSTGLAGVPLIRPEELSGMKRGRQIIVRPEARPVRGRVMPFFRRRAWAAMTDPNPYRGR
ncbi:type IV secretory system conjugative DNA transfer family protein [Siccirubricoccus phaeus]|uniref:type IV secretory system conjugative DNA transfer family protein n=1 Tax=Siccirubricoccus phaeus TaxID=2595053 RepID=UPI0011F273AC|nr:type IV secretory system conjugative DNA transfer family protein [Siccirubricoccus phaeus]